MKAIKGWATTICALFFSLSLHAQNSPISLSDTCALRTMLDGMFANLEKGRITSGLLRDFAVEQENLTPYSGTVLVDSNQVNMMKLGFLLPTLQSARVNTGIGRFSAADKKHETVGGRRVSDYSSDHSLHRAGRNGDGAIGVGL